LERAERIRELYERYTSAKVTEAELAEFFALADEPANEEIFNELFGATWDELEKADPRNRRLTPIHQTVPSHQLTPIRKLWPARRIAAAAAIFIGLATTTYFILKSKPATPTETVATAKTPTDMAPGSNKATLTLGNGAKMILDSEAVGDLAQQGNTKITKTDSGRLAYIVNNNARPNKTTIIEENILTTPRGGEYQLILPDGTKVWLNSASSITYPTAFSGTQRFVKVTGEVYFEVVHNSKMPFVVKAGNQVITDVGTAFNINAYPDEGAITTTLVEGGVKIYVGSKTNLLNPGMQEIASVEGESVAIKNNVDVARFIAWRQGRFEFNNTDVHTILRQISRWYDVDIKTEGAITNETFGGGISRKLPLSDVLRLLESNGLKFRLDGKTLYVSNK
jgi:transmembrane sensor